MIKTQIADAKSNLRYYKQDLKYATRFIKKNEAEIAQLQKALKQIS